ncbi:MAG TPA: hypothetical protein VMF31_05215 [Solirubrobacterales bacterium]|nr:hypothetical protein [Solirubrobacterales bacterium]
MDLQLGWMRPEAPYMPIATLGLLSALEDAGDLATAAWREAPIGLILEVFTNRSPDEVADAIIEAPWPDLGLIPWATTLGQAIKPMLSEAADPVSELRRLRRAVSDRGLAAERRLLDCLVTEAALDDGGVPGRNRLLRGVKADLSSVKEKMKLDRETLAVELVEGPLWKNGGSGLGLGLSPEVQTFGGTTGRNPSSVGSHSVLLYKLLWLGLLRLPPYGVLHRGRRMVGGPLITDQSSVSWPIWTSRLDSRQLKTYFSMSEIHEPEPNVDFLSRRGVTAVYRSTSVPINTMVSVFRWGRRVA